MTEAGIRADPATRLPARAGRGITVAREAAQAWATAGDAVRRLGPRVPIALIAWGGLRAACLRLLSSPDAAPFWATAPGLACRYGLTILLATGPVLLAGAILPAMHRLILDAPAPPRRAALTRAARLTLALFALVLAGLVLLNACRLLPLLLIGRLGRISTLLTMILVLPSACLALAALLRLSLGLPALSLGLPRALAEGWAIGQGRMVRAVLVWGTAMAPPLVAMAVWLWWRPHPRGWPALFLRPCIDMAFVSLTASLTGVFYRANRLAPAFRPDRRPSRHPAQRKPPVFQ